MRFVPSGLFALAVMAVSLPAHAETTVDAVVAACTPSSPAADDSGGLETFGTEPPPVPQPLDNGDYVPQLEFRPPPEESPNNYEIIQLDPNMRGKQPAENTLIPAGARSVIDEVDVALALPPRFLGGVRRAVVEVTRVAQNGGDDSSSGVSSGCSDAIAQYVAELQGLPGATTAAIEAGLADLVYKLATTSIPSGGGSAVAAAITLAASYSTNGNLKYNAQKLANDVADDKLDSSVGSAGGLTSASLS